MWYLVVAGIVASIVVGAGVVWVIEDDDGDGDIPMMALGILLSALLAIFAAIIWPIFVGATVVAFIIRHFQEARRGR